MLKNVDALQNAAQTYAVTLTSREDKYEGSKETQPEKSRKLKHNDTYYKLQNKHLSLMNAEALEKKCLDGEGVTIAVIDSGVTPKHQDLDYSRILDGYDYDNSAEMKADALIDNDGHGTAVTGILTAKADNSIGVAGLLSKAKVVPLKVTPKKNDDNSSKLVAQAITDAVDKYQVDVITTSLEVKDTEELAAAVKHAAEQNVLITGAAGNSSKAANNGADPYVYPASYDEVISVGAVDLNKKVRSTSQKNDKVFVTAPGEKMAVLDLSWNKRCKLADGTSYASPMVAALAVAAKQYNKDITLAEFKELLQNTSQDAGAEGYDNSYGYGIVDYAAFIRALYNITVEYTVSLNQTELELKKGETSALTAAVTPEDAENTEVVWSSSDESVVTVNDQGVVTAVAPGSATVTASCAGDETVTAECEITVKKYAAPQPPQSESLPTDGTPADGTWTGSAACSGFGYSVTLKAEFKDGKLTDLKDFALVNNDDEDNEDFAYMAWNTLRGRLLSASGGSVDTVSGATHSSSAILAAYRAAYAQAVSAASSDTKPAKVTLSNKELNLSAGETALLTVSVEPENADNKKVNWKSSDEAVATVDASGTVTAVSPGSATITVTSEVSENVYDECKVTVMESAPSGIESETEPQTETTAKTQTITAKNHTKALGDKAFSLGAKAKTALSYKSSDTKVAKVDQNGKVTIKGVGTANITITATGTDEYTSAKKTVTITVNPKGVSLKKVAAGKKQIAVNWKENKAVNGYQIQYSTDKKFKKDVKSVKISKNKTVNTTVKKLKAKKKYYVRIRTFKKVGKKTYNSSWSKVMNVTVK